MCASVVYHIAQQRDCCSDSANGIIGFCLSLLLSLIFIFQGKKLSEKF